MADVHSKEIRSKNMSAIKAKGNKSTEISFLRLLKKNKVTGWRRHVCGIYGHPDFIFPKKKLCIFIDGCYWHGCKKCYIRPKTNKKFWDNKIIANKKRDKRVNRCLKQEGWRVLRIWEHQLKKDQPFYLEKIRKFLLR